MNKIITRLITSTGGILGVMIALGIAPAYSLELFPGLNCSNMAIEPGRLGFSPSQTNFGSTYPGGAKATVSMRCNQGIDLYISQVRIISAPSSTPPLKFTITAITVATGKSHKFTGTARGRDSVVSGSASGKLNNVFYHQKDKIDITFDASGSQMLPAGTYSYIVELTLTAQ